MTKKIKVHSTSKEARNILREYLKAFFHDMEAVQILEAGCGSGSLIDIPKQGHVTGIDISKEEMDKNSVVHEKIIGDVQTYNLPTNKFNLVVCWDVLEHLPHPDRAMMNMLQSVAPGGLLLLAFPNVLSIKGLVAKFTPLWVHSVFNKFVYGKRAGNPGLINFPTFLRWSIMPERVIKFAQKDKLNVELACLYESGVQRRFRKKIFLGDFLTSVIEALISFCSFGKISFQKSDCLFLFQKRS